MLFFLGLISLGWLGLFGFFTYSAVEAFSAIVSGDLLALPHFGWAVSCSVTFITVLTLLFV